MTGTRLRIRWRKLATILIVGYLGFWSAVSVGHIISLWNQEQVLNHQIAQTRTQNRALQAEILQLQQPATLKQILTGKQALPFHANLVGSAPGLP